MNQSVNDAMARSRVPDHSSGPMSLAKQDRRALADEVDRLQRLQEAAAAVVDAVSRCDHCRVELPDDVSETAEALRIAAGLNAPPSDEADG